MPTETLGDFHLSKDLLSILLPYDEEAVNHKNGIQDKKEDMESSFHTLEHYVVGETCDKGHLYPTEE